MKAAWLGAGLMGAAIEAAQILAQTPAQSGPPRAILSAGGIPAAASVEREIDDPATGDRWLLEREAAHPGGPGRLVLLVRGGARIAPSAAEAAPPQELPVIHAGERLVVEENTPVVTARLEAVALGTAMRGTALDVRLEIGGRVLRAVATGPGRAALVESGIQP